MSYTEDWNAGWNYLWQQAQSLYADKVRSNPKAYEGQVTAFMRELATARGHLDQIKATLGPRGNRADEVASFNRMARQHYELSNRFYADTRPTQQTQLGFVPVLVVGLIAIGVSGTAWAAATWNQASALREQTGVMKDQTTLAGRELDARVDASKEGRQLQESTLKLPPPPPPPPAPARPEDGFKGLGKWMLGGLAVVTGILVVPQFLNRPKN